MKTTEQGIDSEEELNDGTAEPADKDTTSSGPDRRRERRKTVLKVLLISLPFVGLLLGFLVVFLNRP